MTTFEEARSLGGKVPRSTEEAQFSVAWPVAALIVDGEVGPEQVVGRIHDSAVRDLAARVEVVESAELTRLVPLAEAGDPEGKSAAVVSIDLSDGRRLVSGLADHVLYPESPWGWDEVDTQVPLGHRRRVAPGDADRIVSFVRELPERGGRWRACGARGQCRLTIRVCKQLNGVTACSMSNGASRGQHNGALPKQGVHRVRACRWRGRPRDEPLGSLAVHVSRLRA